MKMKNFNFVGTFQHSQFCQLRNLGIPHVPHSMGHSNSVGLEHFCCGTGDGTDGLKIERFQAGSVYGPGHASGTYTEEFAEKCREIQSRYILRGDWGWVFFMMSLVFVTRAGFLQSYLNDSGKRQTLPLRHTGATRILCQHWSYGGGFYGEWLGNFDSLASAMEVLDKLTAPTSAGLRQREYFLVAVGREDEANGCLSQVKQKQKERAEKTAYQRYIGAIGPNQFAVEGRHDLISKELNIKIPFRTWCPCPHNLLFLKEGVSAFKGGLMSFYIKRHSNKIYWAGTPQQIAAT